MDDLAPKIWLEVYRSLPIETAAAMDMHFSQGEPVRKIAATMGLNPKYVSQIINDGVEHLRDNPQLQEIWHSVHA